VIVLIVNPPLHTDARDNDKYARNNYAVFLNSGLARKSNR